MSDQARLHRTLVARDNERLGRLHNRGQAAGPVLGDGTTTGGGAEAADIGVAPGDPEIHAQTVRRLQRSAERLWMWYRAAGEGVA